MTIVITKFGAIIKGETCQVEGCKQPAKYALFHRNDDIKTWLHVCDMHDKSIGVDNQRRYKGVK